MSSYIHVVIVTCDNNYYNFLREKMSTDNIYGTIIKVSTSLFIENKLHRESENLIIIDLDNTNIFESDFKNISNNKNVLIIISATRNSELIRFVKMGIKTFILKPLLNSNYSKENYLLSIRSKLRELNTVGFKTISLDTKPIRSMSASEKIIVIASSTGGTDALEKICRELPSNCPPILIVQHMPTGFTKMFAERLNNFCKVEIREAKDVDILKKGLVLIAPADKHMVILKNQTGVFVKCYIGNKVHGVMPSADVLFESVANIMKDKAVGVILTGMGADGARGLMMMHNNFAKTIGQNKETCVVYGMPKAAFDLGAIDIELPICQICRKMLELV